MRQRAKQRVIREAKEFLAGFGLPWDQYDSGVVENADANGIVLEVVFTHTTTGAQVVVSQLWTSDNGAINQAGSNFGRLVY